MMPKRILLAEKDAAMQQTLTRVLEMERYGVVAANTGDDTAAQFWARPPDLMLLDLNTIAEDEWWAIDEICAADPVLPIVLIVTGNHERREQAVRFGADALL